MKFRMNTVLQIVAEVVPLKQGLKHLSKICNKLLKEVAEVVPLKQGLKLYLNVQMVQCKKRLQR